MARFKFDQTAIDKLINRMQAMGDDLNGPAGEAVLKAGADAAKEAWKQAAEQHGHRMTGHMIESIGQKLNVKKDKDGLFVDIFPQGTDPDTGVRNMEKAAYAHYGVGTTQAASGWIDTAMNNCEKLCGPAMEAAYNEYLSQKG